jgi:antirestriction protein ArdC
MEEALTAPGNMGNVYNRAHEYSLGNMLLFMMQGVREPVASMKGWNKLGRQVLRGSHAKEVIVPVMVQEQSDETEAEKRERIARLVGFKVVRGVFAYSDTDGEPLPEIKPPTWDTDRALDKLGIRRVPFRIHNLNVQGYSKGLEIAVNPVAVNPTKTLFHEVGHVILGHTLPRTIGEYATHRGVKEFEAEGTAYLVMNELELLDEETATRSRGYIRHWLHEERPPEPSIRVAFRAADAILKAGRVALSNTTEGDET